MARLDFTDITILLDRSGSMATIRAATVEAINAFIEEQKSVPGEGCWTVAQFDTAADARRHDEEFPQYILRQVPQGECRGIAIEGYVPRGGTALRDALCEVIDATTKRIAALPEEARPGRVLIVVETDGEENASVRFTAQQLKDKVSAAQELMGWQFIFLGANIDAFAVGGEMAIRTSACMNFAPTRAGMMCSNKIASAGTRNWKAEGAKGLILPVEVPPGAVLPGAAEDDLMKVDVNVSVSKGN